MCGFFLLCTKKSVSGKSHDMELALACVLAKTLHQNCQVTTSPFNTLFSLLSTLAYQVTRALLLMTTKYLASNVVFKT